MCSFRTDIHHEGRHSVEADADIWIGGRWSAGQRKATIQLGQSK